MGYEEDFRKASQELDAVNADHEKLIDIVGRYRAAYDYLMDKAHPTDMVEAQKILGGNDESK